MEVLCICTPTFIHVHVPSGRFSSRKIKIFVSSSFITSLGYAASKHWAASPSVILRFFKNFYCAFDFYMGDVSRYLKYS